jgi:hypothetical protein
MVDDRWSVFKLVEIDIDQKWIGQYYIFRFSENIMNLFGIKKEATSE